MKGLSILAFVHVLNDPFLDKLVKESETFKKTI